MRWITCRVKIAAIIFLGSTVGVGAADSDNPVAQQQRAEKRFQKEASRATVLDGVVNRFIAYDIGQLRGQPGLMANQQFQALKGDKAIPALTRGVNKAARIRSSCPIIVISGKLSRIIRNCKHVPALKYVATNLNSKGNVFYGHYVENIRREAVMRLKEIAKSNAESAPEKLKPSDDLKKKKIRVRPVKERSLRELKDSIVTATGNTLMQTLQELEKRKGAEYTRALADSVAELSGADQQIARGLLSQRMLRMKADTLANKLTDRDAEVRAAAVVAVGYKGIPVYGQLIELLLDNDQQVAGNSHQVLTKMTGEDFGPEQGASILKRVSAVKKWKDWLKDKSDPVDAEEGAEQ